MTMLLEGENRTEYFAQAEKGKKYKWNYDCYAAPLYSKWMTLSPKVFKYKYFKYKYRSSFSKIFY